MLRFVVTGHQVTEALIGVRKTPGYLVETSLQARNSSLPLHGAAFHIRPLVPSKRGGAVSRCQKPHATLWPRIVPPLFPRLGQRRKLRFKRPTIAV
jgi:hypothetical protein